jgi:sarcosine oxidase
MADHRLDVIVIGGGTMGSGAAWALGKRGVRALVLEQFQHVHALGSHGGKTRIIRQAYAESPDYVPLVQRAEALWLALEEETGTRLLYRTGGLDLAASGYAYARDSLRSVQEHHLPHEWLSAAEIRHRWPAWTIGDEWEACYSPQTGYLVVEPALRALARAAERRGVTLKTDEPACRWRADQRGVEVQTDAATYRADRLIVTAGAWAGTVLSSLGLPLTVLRKVVWWVAVEDPGQYALGRFPIFISEGPEGIVYGFPIHGPDGLKIGNHAGGQVTSPESVDRVAHDDELDEIRPFARRALRGVTDRVLDRAVCLYTMTPDRDFIVDRHPELPRVVFAAGFSGHGFKFAPEIGDLLAELALDESAAPFPRFALRRLLPDSYTLQRFGPLGDADD